MFFLFSLINKIQIFFVLKENKIQNQKDFKKANNVMKQKLNQQLNQNIKYLAFFKL